MSTDLHARHKRLLEQQAALTALTQSRLFHGEALEQAVELVTEWAAHLMRIERVSLWRYTETRSAIRCEDLYERGPDRHSRGAELLAEHFPAYFQALSQSESIVADDAHTDPRTREFSQSYLGPLGITAMMDIPIHLQGRLAGVLCHEQIGQPVAWTPEDRLLGTAMANLVALAIERSERQRAERELSKTRDAAQDEIREHTAELRFANSRLAHEVAVLKASEECFKTALRISPIAACLHDRELRYTWIHDPNLGFAPEQVLGKTDFEVLDHDLAMRMARVKRRVLETGVGERVEMPAHAPPRADTEFFDLVVEPLRDAGGAVIGLACTGVNITERKRAQAELKAAKEAAEAANRAKTEFLANVSHDLRTPLNSVLGYAQLLRSKGGLSDEQQKTLRIIQGSGEHLLGLIDDILDMAKIEAGTLDIHAEDFDLPDLLEDLATSVRPRTAARGLSFTRADWSDIPERVRGDGRRLRQVLTNLLDNAIKYTQTGGMALKCGEHEGRLRFVVEDTGIGIGPEHLAEIFEVFHQVRDPGRYAEGTGLGLAICKRLVRLMGGELRVSSTLGMGSRFWFDLVLPPAGPVIAPASRRIIEVEGSRRRVLVVDDEAENRELLRDILTPLGFELYEAADGEAGCTEAEALRPDAILMDMRMPRLDGLGAIRRIRAHGRLRDTIIIVISASAFEHDRAQCLEAGADDFLPKPFRRERLLDLLRTHLGLTLRYAEGATCEAPVPPPAADIVPPSAESIARFLAAARQGDIETALAEARALEASDARYAPFAAEVRRLAEGFQMKRLRQWLEGYNSSGNL